jgi:alpha-glucosidase
MDLKLTSTRLGDNVSEWDKYRVSIAQMLAFASMFQVPMVGSDVCGFASNTTEELCARWARLGAFYTFFRNHNELGSIPQEFYRWSSVAESARKAIDIRYKLLDYIYTAFRRQTQTGEPFLQPMFYLYPSDNNTYGNELQFFYGDDILVSPVIDGNQTSVDAYFPDDIFYDWNTGAALRGHGANVTLSNIDVTEIPIHIRGGSIIPIRSESAMTTTELRKKSFQLIIAPGLDGTASGSLYLDDGDSLERRGTLELEFKYRNGCLQIMGKFDLRTDLKIKAVTLLGQKSAPREVTDLESANKASFDSARQSVTLETSLDLTGPSEIKLN